MLGLIGHGQVIALDWIKPWRRLVNSDQLVLSLDFLVCCIQSSGTTVLWWYPATCLKPENIDLVTNGTVISRGAFAPKNASLDRQTDAHTGKETVEPSIFLK